MNIFYFMVEEKEEKREKEEKEVKEEPKEEPKEVKEEPKEESKESLFGAVAGKPVDGVEITFTGNDTLSADAKEEVPSPEPLSVAKNTEEDTVKIMDEPPAEMDEFEDIDSKESFLPMDFEELS
jgi:hypothetical protein